MLTHFQLWLEFVGTWHSIKLLPVRQVSLIRPFSLHTGDSVCLVSVGHFNCMYSTSYGNNLILIDLNFSTQETTTELPANKQ